MKFARKKKTTVRASKGLRSYKPTLIANNTVDTRVINVEVSGGRCPALKWEAEEIINILLPFRRINFTGREGVLKLSPLVQTW